MPTIELTLCAVEEHCQTERVTLEEPRTTRINTGEHKVFPYWSGNEEIGAVLIPDSRANAGRPTPCRALYVRETPKEIDELNARISLAMRSVQRKAVLHRPPHQPQLQPHPLQHSADGSSMRFFLASPTRTFDPANTKSSAQKDHKGMGTQTELGARWSLVAEGGADASFKTASPLPRRRQHVDSGRSF